MRARAVCIAAILSTGPVAQSAWCQATKDQARLILTVSGGVVTGKHLWDIDAQPVQFVVPADTFALVRRIRSTIGIGFGGAYFPGEHFGLGFEGFLIGLGYEDGCRHVFSSGNSDVATVCRSIQGSSKSATAVALSVSPIARINSRSLVSPYARGNLGLVFSNQSSIRTAGFFSTEQGVSELIVYDDDSESRVQPAFALGVGFTAAIAQGYQLRWEVRDNIVGVQRVTSATVQARTIPPHEVTYKHLFSMSIGFDVVLERRPGRRY